MTLSIENATTRLSRDIDDSEKALLKAMEKVTALTHSAALAQRHADAQSKAKAVTILRRLQKINGSLINAQADLARVHGSLLEIGVEVGAFEEPTCPDRELFRLNPGIGNVA